MKRFFAALAVFLLLLSLVGCGGDATSDGLLSDFTSFDLNGEEVDASIFEGHTLTMVNVWATFCAPCIREMPHLAKLADDYADRGFQIIGVVIDVADSQGNLYVTEYGLAQEIVALTGADYRHLIPSPSLAEAKLSEVTAVPETFFVDENGNQVGESYLGAKSYDDWAAIVDSLLEEVA